MTSEQPRVPGHLRRFVVEQDYQQYTAIDQAVWRFVLLQMHARLVDTAHPIYRAGLAATGMSVDSIPRIAEMNEKLSRFGWGAVCVDGFVPPRAFQEFQAEGLLPIAADIRTRQHLPYTPAPDIIHEAAGHAPILPDPGYARYLRRIGQLGAEAFTRPADDEVFVAVRALSEIKEDPAAGASEVAVAEARLRAVMASAPEPSEAARLSRLYWWTAEYGLVGSPRDYKIYGAGLLSSLGESHSFHEPAVHKLPLDERCIDVAYDITKPQPQLFVAPSFEALHEVLDRVAAKLRADAATSLERAVQSGELASVEFSSGGWVMGRLAETGPRSGSGPSVDAPAWLAFDGPVGLAWHGNLLPAGDAHAAEAAPDSAPGTAAARYFVLTGRLVGGHRLETLSDADVAARRDPHGGRHRFEFETGAAVEGRLERVRRGSDGAVTHIRFTDVRLALPGLPAVSLPRYSLFAAGDVVRARAGAIDPAFPAGGPTSPSSPNGPGDTTFSPARVPRPRTLPEHERRLLYLFERAERAWRSDDAATVAAEFGAVHAELASLDPEEWLLRWNLLESLLRAPGNEAMKRRLQSELEQLEARWAHRQPIASGLRTLFARATPAS